MSTPDYPQILVRRYPGRLFTMQDVTDPATLIANDGGSVPTKDELDALWPSVESEIQAEQLARRQQSKLLNTAPDALLQLLEVLADGVIDTRGALPAAVKANLDATLTTRLAVARNASEAIAHGDAAGVLPGVARRELDHQPELGGQVRAPSPRMRTAPTGSLRRGAIRRTPPPRRTAARPGSTASSPPSPSTSARCAPTS